ncbi:hypothetical protein C8J56DRAFT_1051862 [Mycena floridula]|nr:hypothetical protein C8J56DRAFT_1051862 [Mycena floridula]
MVHIPNELLAGIVNELQRQDLNSFCLVSHRFWILGAAAKYRTVDITMDSPLPEHQKAIIRIIERAGDKIHTLAVSGRSLAAPFVLEVLGLCKHIRALALIDCVNTEQFQPRQHPRLISLCVSNPESTPDISLLERCFAAYPNLSSYSLGCPEHHIYWESVRDLLKDNQLDVAKGAQLCLWGSWNWKERLFDVFSELRPRTALSVLQMETSGGFLQRLLDKHRNSLIKLRIRIDDRVRFSFASCSFLTEVNVSLRNGAFWVGLLCEAVRSWKVGQKLEIRMSFACSTVDDQGDVNHDDQRFWHELDDIYVANDLMFNLTFDIAIVTRVIQADEAHHGLLKAELPSFLSLGRLHFLPLVAVSSRNPGGLYSF